MEPAYLPSFHRASFASVPATAPLPRTGATQAGNAVLELLRCGGLSPGELARCVNDFLAGNVGRVSRN